MQHPADLACKSFYGTDAHRIESTEDPTSLAKRSGDPHSALSSALRNAPKRPLTDQGSGSGNVIQRCRLGNALHSPIHAHSMHAETSRHVSKVSVEHWDLTLGVYG